MKCVAKAVTYKTRIKYSGTVIVIIYFLYCSSFLLNLGEKLNTYCDAVVDDVSLQRSTKFVFI